MGFTKENRMNAPHMPRLSVLLGVLLIVQGVVFWGLTGFEPARFTAAIPAFFGILIGGLGLVAGRVPAARMHVMHLNVLLALLGIGGGVSMFMKGLGSEERGEGWMAKLIDQGLLAVFCGIFVVLCIKSFVASRRSKTG